MFPTSLTANISKVACPIIFGVFNVGGWGALIPGGGDCELLELNPKP